MKGADGSRAVRIKRRAGTKEEFNETEKKTLIILLLGDSRVTLGIRSLSESRMSKRKSIKNSERTDIGTSKQSQT